VARTPQWVEQAGKGASGKLGRLTVLTLSAPPLRFTWTSRDFHMATQRGRAKYYYGETS